MEIGRDQLFEDLVDDLCKIQKNECRYRKRHLLKKEIIWLNKELELGLKIDI